MSPSSVILIFKLFNSKHLSASFRNMRLQQPTCSCGKVHQSPRTSGLAQCKVCRCASFTLASYGLRSLRLTATVYGLQGDGSLIA